VNRLVQMLVAVALWLCDRIAGPQPETEADQAREREEAEKVVPFSKNGAA